jgi:hypothetical protein
MLAKYSPTVHAAYDANQEWHDKYAGDDITNPFKCLKVREIDNG